MNNEILARIADVIALPLAGVAIVMQVIELPWLFKSTSYLAIHATVLAVAIYALMARWPKKMKLIGLMVLAAVVVFILINDGLSNWVTFIDLIPEKLGGGSGTLWRIVDLLDVAMGLCLLPAIIVFLVYKRYIILNKNQQLNS